MTEQPAQLVVPALLTVNVTAKVLGCSPADRPPPDRRRRPPGRPRARPADGPRRRAPRATSTTSTATARPARARRRRPRAPARHRLPGRMSAYHGRPTTRSAGRRLERPRPRPRRKTSMSTTHLRPRARRERPPARQRLAGPVRDDNGKPTRPHVHAQRRRRPRRRRDQTPQSTRPNPHRLFLDSTSSPTLAEFLKTGFRTHAAIRPRKTREQYQWAVDLHLQELLDEPLVALTVPRLVEHQTFLLEHGRGRRTPSGPCSRSSARCSRSPSSTATSPATRRTR